jgi:hypothetical protein
MGHMTMVRGGARPQYIIDNVAPMNILTYIRACHVTDKYIRIFLRTKEYKLLYSSVLCSSAISSVN